MINKIIIFGSSGYIGKYLANFFADKCVNLITVSRKQEAFNQPNRKHFIWDGETLGDWARQLEATDLIINLAGKSVNCRYTEKNKAAIFSSRLLSTKIIGEAVLQTMQKPKVWMNMSSATIYRHATDFAQDEYKGEIKNDFSVQVCKAWEASFDAFNLPETRKIKLRTAIVIGKHDGAFPRIINLAKYYLGGKMGSGNQMFSWIHEADFAEAILFLSKNNNAKDAVNIVSPNAVTNNILMQTIRQKMKKPFGIPTPIWLLKFGAILIGTETELILKSRWVYPKKLMDLGFNFNFENINAACEDIL
jgi:uncharacterized protein